MATYGLTSAGLVRPTLNEQIKLYVSALNEAFGSTLSTSTSSRMGSLIQILAYQDTQLWDLAEAVYTSRTVNGAEGIYLDNVLNLRGVYRNAASEGYGVAIVGTSSSALWTDTIPTTTTFSASNGYEYFAEEETALSASVYGFTLTKAQLVAAGTSVIFYIRNITSDSVVSTTITTSSDSALSNLATFIQANCASADTGYVFVSGTTLYVGFDSDDTDTLVGLGTGINFWSSVVCGVKYSGITVKCSTAGKYEVLAGDLESMSPTPSGYKSIQNLVDFDPGTDTETDAEYISRFNEIVDEANASTKPAIYKALLDIDNVQSVKLIVNNTSVDDTTTGTASDTFQTVIYGGESADIAECLATKKPIDALTSGTSSYTYTYEDGSTEAINFTRATEASYTVKISYKTVDGYVLPTGDQETVQEALVSLADNFTIGGTVFNTQLNGVVFSSLTYGALKSLTVTTKLTSAADTAYSSSDITPSYNVIPMLSADNILFEQITD